MPAIRDKESGEQRELTRGEKERIMTNKDDARGRRLKKLRTAENRANAEEIKEHRKKEAMGKEIDVAPAELFHKLQAVEARNEDETTNETSGRRREPKPQESENEQRRH